MHSLVCVLSVINIKLETERIENYLHTVKFQKWPKVSRHVLTQLYTGLPEKTLENDLISAFHYFVTSISVVETPPVAEETPVEEQAPVEDKKEVTLEDTDKKSIFASFCGCFGGKSQVVEKPDAEEEAKEKDEEAEKPAE